MSDTYDGERIPVLYSIHHCYYDRYPNDADVLELTDETIETMKEAYRQIRIAEIYATRMDWMMSGDDGEDSFRERIKEDLAEFKKEYAAKDWTHINENEE
jgi:wyosine [tRNA(Phe)-imidazoG37] synthetase (radical SAM superfamily)